MNLKQRFSLIFSVIFSVLLGVVLLILYTLFANYRRDELQETLTETGESTLDLVMEIRDAGRQYSQSIDNSSIIKLYNEKVLVFDDSMKLIYSDVKGTAVNWSVNDLRKLNKGDLFSQDKNNNTIVGFKKMYKNMPYFVLVSAEDNNGVKKMNYLKYLLLSAFIISSSGVWLLSFYLSRKSLAPLDHFTRNIREISDKNLNSRLDESGRNDEVTALAHSFNLMLERLDRSFRYQKEFVGNASHELRTPIARISSQIENLINSNELSSAANKTLKSINDDMYELSDIVSSLLLLSRLEASPMVMNGGIIRIDEVLFNCIEHGRKFYPDFKVHFEIQNQTDHDPDFELQGDESLLTIAFDNLLKNAYSYSDNKEVKIFIIQQEGRVKVTLSNSGPVPEVTDTKNLFNAFIRGSNAKHSKGYGLGLGIVQRIVQYHKAEIKYFLPDSHTNQIEVYFGS